MESIGYRLGLYIFSEAVFELFKNKYHAELRDELSLRHPGSSSLAAGAMGGSASADWPWTGRYTGSATHVNTRDCQGGVIKRRFPVVSRQGRGEQDM